MAAATTPPSFPDTPIYDSLVAERGTPQIAPIRVPAAYDTGQQPARAAVGAARPARRPRPSSPPTAIRRRSSPRRCSRRPPRTSRSRPRAPRGYPGPQPQQPQPRAPAARATRRCAPRLPAPGPRPRTRTRTTTSSTAATDADYPGGCHVPAGRMTPWGMPALHSIHVHPVKAVRGHAPREAVVEPWGLAGDRRWVLIDDGGKVVTQRQQPRLALAAAELLPGGGVRAVRARPRAADRPRAGADRHDRRWRSSGQGRGGPRRRRRARLVQRVSRRPTCGSCTWTTRRTRRPSTRSTRCPARPSASPTATRCCSPRSPRSTPSTR